MPAINFCRIESSSLNRAAVEVITDAVAIIGSEVVLRWVVDAVAVGLGVDDCT